MSDLKKCLVDNIDQFSACLAEKTLVYGAGRPLGYADRKVVKRLVADVKKTRQRFSVSGYHHRFVRVVSHEVAVTSRRMADN